MDKAMEVVDYIDKMPYAAKAAIGTGGFVAAVAAGAVSIPTAAFIGITSLAGGGIAGAVGYTVNSAITHEWHNRDFVHSVVNGALTDYMFAGVAAGVYGIVDAVKSGKVTRFIGDETGSVGGKNTIDDVYDGVKQASEYLKQQVVPRQYRKQILESFDVRTIKLETAGENTYGLRFYGGNANAEGRYLFETFSPLTNRANLALPYKWNSMTGIQQFQIKSGTTMITGAAAPQSSFGAQYTGGATQWYINNLEDLIKCQ